MVKKKLITILCIITTSMLCLLPGCEQAENLKKQDIEEYVKNEIGLTNFTISNNSKKVKHDNEYLSDILWYVTDNQSDVDFHVLDNHAGAGEYSFGTTNHLQNDYGQQLILQYANKLPKMSQIKYEILTPHTETNGITYDYYSHLRKYGYETGWINGSYRTRTELKNVFNDITMLEEELNKLDIILPKELKVYVCHIFENRDDIKGHELSDGLISLFETKEEREESLKRIDDGLLENLLWFRYDTDKLNEYTQDEITKFTSETSYVTQLGIYHNNNNYPDMYNDLTALRSQMNADVSFGSLYEILKRENYPIDGTARHYSFTGIDNKKYEISYDFKDTAKHYDYGYRWYYLTNGEKTELNSDHTYGFLIEEIFEMTNIEISLGDKHKNTNKPIDVTTETKEYDDTTTNNIENEQSTTSTYTISFPDINVPEVVIPKFDTSSS